ncbi:MAG: sigma 54-interacting transcriptional regulator [Myxococcales bacterium]|nr:sigma 54-interacting transcriptional regulator [Myxococcales bacterium]
MVRAADTERDDSSDAADLESERGVSRRQARLLVEQEGRAPRVIVLPEGAAVRLGRDAEVEVRLDDAKVSRVHAELSLEGGALKARDLGSRNGTTVNGVSLAPEASLAVGDVLALGAVRVSVVSLPGRVLGAQTAPSWPIAEGARVVCEDPASVRLSAQVRRLAASPLPVLVVGESGTGKEVIARMIHRYSHRAGAERVTVRCETLAEPSGEARLFGAATATGETAGLIDQVEGGTLHLDDVLLLPTLLQVKLLRLLDEGRFSRLGSREVRKADVRVVATSRSDLAPEVKAGRFRDDLYFRLSGVTVRALPLRERTRDIVPLAESFLALHGGAGRLGRGVAEVLRSYRWPGNVTELRNAIEQGFAGAESGEVRVEHLPPRVRGEYEPEPVAAVEDAGLRLRVDELERKAIVAALDATGWNQSRAAELLSISRRGLIYKMERHGLKARPGHRG